MQTPRMIPLPSLVSCWTGRHLAAVYFTWEILGKVLVNVVLSAEHKCEGEEQEQHDRESVEELADTPALEPPRTA